MFQVGQTVTVKTYAPAYVATVVGRKGQSTLVVEAPGQAPHEVGTKHVRAFSDDPNWRPAKPGYLYPGDIVKTPSGLVSKVHDTSKSWCGVLGAKPFGQQIASLLIPANGFTPEVAVVAEPPVKTPKAAKPQKPGTFKTPKQSEEWVAYWDAWHKALAPEDRKAVYSYTNSWYGEVNKQLRSGAPAGIIKHVEHMDAALSKGKVPSNIIVWRAGSTKFDKTIEVGTTFVDLGYGSTSISRSVAFRWGSHNKALFKIRVPQGAVGAYVNGVSGHKSEKELILPRGCHYKVVEKLQEGHRLVVVCDLVYQEEAV